MTNIEQYLRSLKQRIPYFNYHNETRMIVSMINRFVRNNDIAILDVGCGHGRNIAALKEVGFTNITGVDKNPETIALNKRNGHACIHFNELKKEEKFDLIVMSHIIEHFIPQDIIPFMENYLDHLKEGGFVVIATPMIGAPKFYSDLDHVKAYYPLPLLRIFGEGGGEVQYYARNVLSYKSAIVHRAPINLFQDHLLMCIDLNWFQKAVEFLLNVLFYLSHGIIGQSIGWVGAFQKVSRRT